MRAALQLAAIAVAALLAAPAVVMAAPQPISPADGAHIENPEDGVELTISASADDVVWVEASEDPRKAYDGSFLDPLRGVFQTGNTHDPNVKVALIDGIALIDDGGPGVIFDRGTGVVYWQPYIIGGCVPVGELDIDCIQEGVTRSFSYDFSSATDESPEEPTQTTTGDQTEVDPAARCRNAHIVRRNVRRRFIAAKRIAGRRARIARARTQRRHRRRARQAWRTVGRRKAVLRRATRRMRRVCA